MTLSAPLGLVAAAAALPLLLWYLLRPRRRRVPVGSTYLWRAVEWPSTAATPWQRFRGDTTFWLVLAALLALALALARPGVAVPAQLGDHTIVVVDASGSMLADEDGVTRAELARREVSDLIDGLSAGQEVSVVLAGARPEVIVSGSSDGREVVRALARATTGHGPADLADALTLATSLQRPGERTVVHVVTDGRLPGDAEALAPPGTGVITVGTDRPNVAITRLATSAAGAGDHRVLTQVRSFAAMPVTGRVVLRVGDVPVVEQPLRLASRAIEDLVMTVPASGGEILTATLEVDAAPGGEYPDALAHDDTAQTVLTDVREVTVLVAGPGNTFVAAALGAVPGVTVETAAGIPDDLAGVDLLVADRVGAADPPVVPTLYLAPTAYPDGFAVTGSAELPTLTFQATDHPLLDDVDLTGLAVAEVARVDAPEMTALAAGPDGPLLLAGRIAGVPVVAVPFDPMASDLPLRPAWPLLVANAVSWLTGSGTGANALPAGTVATLETRADVVHATPPDGRDPIAVTVADGLLPTLLLDRVGIWTLEHAGGPDDGRIEVLPVTPAADQSDLSRPRADTEAIVADGDATEAQGIASLVRPVVLIALLLALGEWLWTHAVRQRLHDRRRERSRRRADRTVARTGAGPGSAAAAAWLPASGRRGR